MYGVQVIFSNLTCALYSSDSTEHCRNVNVEIQIEQVKKKAFAAEDVD